MSNTRTRHSESQAFLFSLVFEASSLSFVWNFEKIEATSVNQPLIKSRGWPAYKLHVLIPLSEMW